MLQDIIFLILGAVLGGIIGWITSVYFYRKSNKEQAALYNKLTSDIRELILADPRDQLSVEELNELLELKTQKDGYYIACPQCGNTKLKYGSFIDDREETWYATDCPSCGWSDVSQ